MVGANFSGHLIKSCKAVSNHKDIKSYISFLWIKPISYRWSPELPDKVRMNSVWQMVLTTALIWGQVIVYSSKRVVTWKHVYNRLYFLGYFLVDCLSWKRVQRVVSSWLSLISLKSLSGLPVVSTTFLLNAYSRIKLFILYYICGDDF